MTQGNNAEGGPWKFAGVGGGPIGEPPNTGSGVLLTGALAIPQQAAVNMTRIVDSALQKIMDKLQADLDAERRETARLREALEEIRGGPDEDRDIPDNVANWDSYEAAMRHCARIAHTALTRGAS